MGRTSSWRGFAAAARMLGARGGGGPTPMAALRLHLADLGAHGVGRQRVRSSSRPGGDTSIDDRLHRLPHLAVPQI